MGFRDAVLGSTEALDPFQGVSGLFRTPRGPQRYSRGSQGCFGESVEASKSCQGFFGMI